MQKAPLINCLKLCGVLGVIIILAACTSTSITISRLEPPRYTIPSNKKLAVLEFVGTDKAPESGRAVASMLIARLAPTGYYQLIERAQIQSVIRELKFATTDYVDPSNASKIGKLLGADYMLVGEVTAYEVEDNVTVKPGHEVAGGYYDQYGRFIETRTVMPPREVIVRSGTVSATFRLIDAETGRIIASDKQTRSFRKSSEEFLGTGGLPSKEDVLSRLTEQVVDAFARQIAPYKVREQRVLEYGKHRLTRKGVQLAKNGLWREAVETWQEARQDAPQESAIYYNLGVASETKGDYEAAEALYQKALELKPNSTRYMQSLNRVRQLKRLYEKHMQSQEN